MTEGEHNRKLIQEVNSRKVNTEGKCFLVLYQKLDTVLFNNNCIFEEEPFQIFILGMERGLIGAAAPGLIIGYKKFGLNDT